MKICLINTFYYPQRCGGAEESVRSLAKSLQSKGHSVVVIATGDKNESHVIDGVAVHRVRVRNIYGLLYEGALRKFNALWHVLDSYNVFAASQVREILERERPDVVHTNNLKGISVAAWQAANGMGVPVVHTLRDYYLLCPKAIMFRRGKNCLGQCFVCRCYGFLRRCSTPKVACVVGISDFILRRHLSSGYFRSAKQYVVHNSYDGGATAKCGRRDGEVLRLGFIGHLGPFKGIEMLVDAVKSFPEGSVSLTVAGVGAGEYVRDLVKSSSCGSITFVGYREPREFFRKIDVLVVPSLWHEPLGRVVFEGYAFGVPAIASKRGGIPEIVEEGVTGFLFDPDEDAGLARAIERINDPVLIGRMSINAASKSKEFRSEIISEEYLRVYETATGKVVSDAEN